MAVIVVVQRYHDRSALHVGAVRAGKKSRLWESLLAAERLASGHLDRLDTLLDEYGRTPNDYDGPATAVTPYSVLQDDSYDQISSGLAEAETGVVAPAARADRQVSVSVDGQAVLAVDNDDNGGWGGSVSAQPPAADDDCELDVYYGMPSRALLTDIIERNKPSIFRGAAANWTFRSALRFHPTGRTCSLRPTVRTPSRRSS